MSFSRQKGVALIMVLVIVAMATVLAATYLGRQHLAIQRASYQVFSDQGYFYALATEEWAKIVLANDFKEGKIDSLDEEWSVILPFIDIEGGYLSARLSDLQARLNINNLIVDEKLDKLVLQRVQHLLDLYGAPKNLAEALIDWLDHNRDASGFNGAEDDYYTRLELPYLAANREMSDISELRLVRGVSDKLYQAISPYLTALPANVGLNVNTAEKETLKALNLTDGVVDSIISERESSAFESITDFMNRLSLNEADFDKKGLGVSSQYFLLNTLVVIADVSYAEEALIYRDRKGRCRILRRWRLPYVSVPAVDPVDTNEAKDV